MVFNGRSRLSLYSCNEYKILDTQFCLETDGQCDLVGRTPQVLGPFPALLLTCWVTLSKSLYFSGSFQSLFVWLICSDG